MTTFAADFIRQGGEEEPEGYEALKQTYSM
jgi:hypothetical protein